MVMLSKNARLSYYLNNAPAHAPEDIESTEIIADFSDENVQANITATSWTFYNQDAVTIRAWKDAGKIFEGLPFKIEAYNNLNNIVAFDGLLDLTDNYKDDWDDTRRVTVNMKKTEGLNIFFDQLSALSFGYLESIGVFVANDYQNCKYVVEKKVNLVEELTAGVILYLMTKELITQIKEISDTITEGVAHGAGGITGAIAATVFFIAKLAIQIAYAVSILLVIIDLAKQLFETLLPPVRTHKTLNLRTAMEKVCTHLGYGFNSTIADLDTLYYLPSNPQLEPPKLQDFLSQNVGTQTGIPFASDSHYQCNNFFELMKKMFNGKFAIINGVVQFHPKGAPYWVKSSTYTMPKVKPKTTTTNALDLVGDRVLSFAYDLTDEWTVDNYTGTTYEIQTKALNLTNAKANLVKGFDGVDFDVCLGTAKTELNNLEKYLSNVAGIIDGVVNFFGGNQNFAGKIVNNKTNILKQSSNWHNIPKILKLSGDKLTTNYRSTFSAKQLYNNYYAYDSFVLSNFGGQKEVFEDVKIPFGMNDFIELTNNSYFKDSQNRTGKIISIKWNVLSDTATANYWVKVPFTTLLQETYIEP